MAAVANLSSGRLEQTVKPLAAACYDNNLVNSQGMFLGDQPLRFSLPLLLVQVSVILVLSATAHVVLRRLGQSRFVTHMLVGVFLGPTVLGRSETFRGVLFSERGTYILESVSLVALILFLFSMGVKTDLSLLRRPSSRAVAVGITGALVPLAVTLPVFHALQPSLPEDLRGSSLVTELAVRLSLSSFPVIADALSDLDLLNTDLGRIALTASLITDVTSWFLRACTATVFLVSEAKSAAFTAQILASFVAFVLFVGFVARPAGRYIAYKRTPTGSLLSEGSFVVVVIAALLSALVTDAIGFKYMIGPMMLGLALPGGMPIGATMTERLDSFFIALFLPVYMALSGYRTDLAELTKPETSEKWCALELFVALCVSGKLVGCVAAGLFFAMPFRDTVVLALMLNIRGIVEVAAINNWGDTMKATAEHYSTLTMSMVLITAVSTPLIKLLYDPSGQLARAKRRTLEDARPGAELRVLTCLYSEDHAAPLIDLLEASSGSPVSLIVLHLTELVGRAASVLKPHRSRKSSNPTPSDRIVNAFRYLEQQQASPGAITVSPYVAQAPYSSMHHDVCSLAHSRKANLILLPFHKSSDGARATANNAIRSINRAVLHYAPCSVAILVDHGLAAGSACATAANSLLHRVALYFLGGPDDREALAYAARMPDHHDSGSSGVSLTVVRFKLRNWVGMGGRDEVRDEEALQKFWTRHRDNERVVYVEKTVEDAEGTASVVRSMSEKFDLLIVGRRGGAGEGDDLEGSAALTSGLSDWSEFPELGVLGDMLASAEFASRVSVLVVQQQPPKNSSAAGGGNSIND